MQTALKSVAVNSQLWHLLFSPLLVTGSLGPPAASSLSTDVKNSFV